MWEVKGRELVGRETANNTVAGNPLLNPAKYNEGTPITIEANIDYKGKVRLGGRLLSWPVIWEEHQSGNWDNFVKEHDLPKDTTVWDVMPLTITGTQDKELVAFVHDVEWINKLNAVDKVIEREKSFDRSSFRVMPVHPVEVKTGRARLSDSLSEEMKTFGDRGRTQSLVEQGRY